MDDGEKDEQAPLEPSTADWLSVDQFFKFEPLDVQTTEQNVTSDGHQNDTDFDFDFVSGTAYQTGFEGVYSDSNAQMALGSRFESLPSNPDSRGVNLNDRTVPYLEDWLANSELERLQASTQATTNRILRDFTSSEPVASESYDPACGYPAASGDVVETPNHFQFDNLQFDAPQGPPQEHTNPSGLPMPSEASNGYFQLPVIYNPLETGWETTDFVQTGFPILRGAESMSFIPRSLSEWDSIACGTSQQNPSKTGRLDQKSEVDNAQSGVDPNVMGIDSGARGASWGFELRDGDDSRDNASNSGPQFGSSLAQSVGKDFYTSNLPREAYLLRLRKPLLDIEKDEFVLNPDGTPRVSPITITNYKKVDFLPDVIDYRRLNGAVLIRAELKGASLKIHIIPRIDPNTLRPRQLKNLKKEIQSRKEKQSVDGKPDNEKNIDQELQGYEKVQMEDDDDLEANDEYDKSDGELRSEIATDSKVSRKGRVRYNLNTVAERLSRCLSNMKQKYRKEHGLGFACGTNVLKQPKGSSTKEPTKEASRILEGGSIRIEKLLFNTVGKIDHAKKKFRVVRSDGNGFQEYPLEKPQDIPDDLQTALQKLKPDSWESFTSRDEYIAEYPSYANYEPQGHVDWLPEYHSTTQATSEDKSKERSKCKWSDVEDDTEDSISDQNGRSDHHLHLGPTQSTAPDELVTRTNDPSRTYNSESNVNAETKPLPQRRDRTQTQRHLKRSRSDAELDDGDQTAVGSIDRQPKKKYRY